MNITRSLQSLLDTVLLFLPKLVAFLVILILGYLVAKVLQRVLTRVLQKAGFDGLVERGGIRRALASTDYDAAGILAKIVFYAVMLFVLSTAFGVFGPNPISGYLAAVIGYLPKVFVAILIIVIAAAIAAAVKLLVQGALGALSYGPALANLASVVIIALGVIAALDQLQIAQAIVNGILYAALAAVVGIAIVAIGGGGIGPMRERWERALSRIDEEAPKAAAEARGTDPVEAVKEQAKSYAGADNGRSNTGGATSA